MLKVQSYCNLADNVNRIGGWQDLLNLDGREIDMKWVDAC